ncbi:bactofilin family protein [Vibrio mexicanus]|uniref:bactofilin family protein n=1 Tax=Vibrio mexicanus TaxID=1004326 RepID=UPI000A049709|nr:polymer-forming cytoskeletal protein [Vibrio mexicanus]
MGIFSKQSRAKSQQSATTVIAKGCAIEGQLKLESDIQVDGQIEGQLHVEKALVISQSGSVKGEVFANHVIINGEFEGVCHASRIEILSQGRATGEIYSDDLSIEKGGKFNGLTHSVQDKQVVDLNDAKMMAEG